MTNAQREKQRAACRKYYAKKNSVGPTEETVLFYGYKEPLRKFEGGYGYQGVLSYSKDRDKVQCHLCGGLFRSIGNQHLRLVHDMDAKTYKEKTGLSQNTALIGEGLRKTLMDRPQVITVNNSSSEAAKASLEARKKLWEQAKNDPELRVKLWPKRTLEHKNKLGLCPDQLLDVIKKTKDSFGRVPTMEEFKGFHHGRFIGSIVLTFGSWGNALAKLGLETNWKAHTRKSLIQAMKDFYKVHNRSPHWSDHNRGLLPSVRSYRLHFSSLNEARLFAGLPLRIPVGRKWEDWMPTKAESEKMMLQYE